MPARLLAAAPVRALARTAPAARPPAPAPAAAPAAGSGSVPFSLLAYTGGTLDVGAEAPWVIDLATLRFAQRIPLLFDHITELEFVVGQSESVQAAGGRVSLTGLVMPCTTRARQVIDFARKGYVWQTSIGADPGSVDRVPAGETVEVNGRRWRGPLLVGYETVLREVSFVTLGADRNTSAVITPAPAALAAARRGVRPPRPARRRLSARSLAVVRQVVAERLREAVRAGESPAAVAAFRRQLLSLASY